MVSLIPAVLLCSSIPGSLIRATELGTLGKLDVVAEVKRQFAKSELQPTTTNGLRLAKLVYWSTDYADNPVVLSGLMAVPVGERTTKGLVAFCHGTVVNRENVPSRVRPDGGGLGEARIAMLNFAGGGYGFAAPDYFGLGDHQGIHPYAQRQNDRATIDFIRAAREWSRQNGISHQNLLWLSGYSEGGAIALATAQKLWASGDTAMQPRAVAPLSGNYDVSGTMAKLAMKRGKNALEAAVRLSFMSYFAYGLQQNGTTFDLERLFVPSFASYIPEVFRQEPTDEQFATMLANKAVQIGGATGFFRVIQPEARRALEKGDRNHWLVKALRANDTYDFLPKAPMFFVAIQNDAIVPPENTLKVIVSIRSKATGSRLVRHTVLPANGRTHVTGAAACMAQARKFFDERAPR